IDDSHRYYLPFSGAGLSVRHVCVALCRRAGAVSLVSPEGSAKQKGVGGIWLLAYGLPCIIRLQGTPERLPLYPVSLQVGAGVSLPGVLAAKCGAKVILSDSAELPQCLENCRRSCNWNNITGVPVVGLTWGEISPELLDLPPIDIILGSDVFYEPKDFEDILLTVRFLMERTPRAEFWTTYQVRSADWSIEALLCKWNLKCTGVPLKTFGADRECLAGSELPGRHTVQMMIITLDREAAGCTA
uniref:Methyltransferase-like 23 n=1 Tax=Xenopus tropicalis TaxID=8364 RepID=A0A6I8RL34_XENTR